VRDLGRLPVVDTSEPRRIIGLLRRRDIVHAYELALQRKQQTMQQSRNIRLATYSSARVIEVRVAANSPAADRLIRDVKWPANTVVATVRRHGEVIVPSGDTMLHPDDVLTVVTTQDRQSELNSIVGISKSAPKPQ
jgi:Trk K+ transport system NAD-binding subunit